MVIDTVKILISCIQYVLKIRQMKLPRLSMEEWKQLVSISLEKVRRGLEVDKVKVNFLDLTDMLFIMVHQRLRRRPGHLVLLVITACNQSVSRTKLARMDSNQISDQAPERAIIKWNPSMNNTSRITLRKMQKMMMMAKKNKYIPAKMMKKILLNST